MPKGDGFQDPLENYVEWTRHRYDPGHYLGGTLEPHLRRSALGPKARKRSAILLIAIGLGSVATAVPLAADGKIVWAVGACLPAILFIAAGVRMWPSPNPSGEDSAP